MSCPAVIDVLVPSGPVVVEVVTPGPPGAIGSRWFTGSGVPAADLGAVGDFYLRSNGDVYGPKASGGWGSVQFTLTGTGGGATYLVRIDAASVSTAYVGRAPVGTAESSTGWVIKRRTFTAAGVLLTTTTASGAWTNRASLTYS
jgi:hypothetical protein